ncbi:MAG TPA: Ig-like domain-containing protein, partial [Methanosarcina sp.]|nr:Ig-like domain-containing protein [Methanosarcina sp.]
MPINRIPKVKSVSGKIGDVILTSSDVGLGNVNNTSDLNKPIPTAVQTALNAKQDLLSAGSGISITNGTISYNGTTGVTIDQVNTAIDTKLSGLNLFPTANPDTANGTENTFISGNVLTNDTTATGSLYVTQYKVYTLSQPAGVVYTAGVPSTTSPLGTFLMNADGSWTLTPKLYSYGTYTVNYWVSNGVSNPVMGTLTINLAFVNQPPVTAPDSASGVENTPITITPLANDYDPEGSILSIVALNGTSVVAGQSVNVTNASVLLNSDKSITITPATNFIGTVQFTYTASDGSLTTLGNVSATFTAPQTGGGTSNYVTGTTTLIPFNFAGNVPLKNASVVEPTTGATIKRLTDVTQDAPGFLALYNAYSRYPNENVTGEYVLAFGYNSTTCYVMNRSTGTVVASLAYDNTGLSTHTIGAYH